MLVEALHGFETDLRGRRALVMAHARPGLEPGRLQEVLDPLGLEPSDALREWFGWHDGAGETGRTPSPEDRQRVRWASPAAFVEHLVSRYDEGTWVVGADGLVDGDTLDFP